MEYEKLAREILGEDLFDDTSSFFEEIFERDSKFKIILTRRCFSLFKIFSEILGGHGKKNECGRIITDNNIEFFSVNIKEAIEAAHANDSAPVLIADDIIIYGRTISKIISNCSHGVDDEHIGYVRTICMARNSGSLIEKKYESLILARHIVSSLEWKKFSNKFSRLIKATDKPNTSYVVSCHIPLQKIPEKFLDFCKNEMHELNQTELDELNIKSYVISVSPKKNEFSYLDDFCGLIRVYVYDNLKTLLISPLIILNSMSQEDIDEAIEKIVSSYCNENTAIKELSYNKNTDLYEFKMRMLSLLLSHVLLCDFLKKHEFNCENMEQYDYKEIIQYNFSDKYINDFKEFNANLSQLEFDYFSYEVGEIQHSQEFDDLVFEKAMLDNSMAKNQTNRNAGFNKMGDIPLFTKKFSANLMMLLDSGRAALKAMSNDGKYCSLLYSGEQAFRIMNDQFIDLLPSLNMLENIAYLYNKNSYDLYKKFARKINTESKNLLTDEAYDKLGRYIEILEKTGQQISDIMCVTFVKHDSKKIGRINMLLETFIKEDV